MAKYTFRFRYQLCIRKRSCFLKCRRQFQLFFMKFPKVHSEDLPAAQHRLALPAKFPVTVQRTKFCQMDSGVFFPQFQKRRTLFLFSLKYCLFQDKLCKRPEFIRVASELQSTQKRYQDFLDPCSYTPVPPVYSDTDPAPRSREKKRYCGSKS